jgi:hypothetical protein
MYRQEPNNVQPLLAGEGQLLEMIFEGAELPQILDRVCTALDLQVGNVISLVLLPDDEEHTLHTIEESAAGFGLTAFSCTPILSTDDEFLGTLEMYCCFSRAPNLGENVLIERATHLAALAIQHHNHTMDAESCSPDWNGSARRSPHEPPPSSN